MNSLVDKLKFKKFMVPAVIMFLVFILISMIISIIDMIGLKFTFFKMLSVLGFYALLIPTMYVFLRLFQVFATKLGFEEKFDRLLKKIDLI